MECLQVGNLSARLGEKTRGWLEIPGGPERLPATLIHGAKPGKTVTVMAGTHGSEYVGIEAVIRLSQRLDPSEMSGRVILLHVVNVDGFFGKAQYVNPADGRNLGGIYPGRPDGTASERIAHWIAQEVIGQSDFHMDLHSGDLHEDLDSFGWFDQLEATRDLSMRAAALMGANFVSVTNLDASALGMAARMGVPAISPEVGGCGRWDEEHVMMDVEGVVNILRMMEVLEGEPKARRPLLVRKVAAIKSTAQGCFYPLVEIGQQVTRGQLLGEVRDLFGEPLAEYRAPEAGEIFCVVRSLAIRPGDLLFGLKYE